MNVKTTHNQIKLNNSRISKSLKLLDNNEERKIAKENQNIK